jgi:3-oxoacyl-[acyl-carrier protein] reductase
MTVRTALVTGASRGIGRAVAEQLAADGALVAVHYARDEAAAKEVVTEIETNGGEAFTVQAVFGTDEAIPCLVHALDRELRTRRRGDGGLDILVNNAGITHMQTIEQTTADDYDRMFAINTRAPFLLTQALLPRLRNGGRIINITSGLIRLPYPEGIAYAMTKGALEPFTLALATHLAPRQITVNNVAPGHSDPDANADADPSRLRSNAEARAWTAALSALGRVGTPYEVAATVAFLASDAACWVTGTTLDTTGGAIL